MDQFARLAQQMPTNMKMPTTIGSIKTNTIPLVPKSWGGNALRMHNPFGGQKAKEIPLAPYSAPEASAPPANSPNARPAPEIVTVIEAANSAVNGSAKKVAALLENPQVVKAAQNLVNKITPAKADPAPSKNANAKNSNVKNTTVKNTTKDNANSDEPTANDPTLAGNKKGKYLNNKGKPVGTMVGGRKTRKGKKKSRSRR
jgi:hypothetical protein